MRVMCRQGVVLKVRLRLGVRLRLLLRLVLSLRMLLEVRRGRERGVGVVDAAEVVCRRRAVGHEGRGAWRRERGGEGGEGEGGSVDGSDGGVRLTR
ncbi:hypothetical protein BZA70DRAFT_281015 [Myxozyma melibiosi]|uniref:Uncharacterized protein n=1 Tax=Myxozyma melibiosi TaxID=54550 RepID=A0ABR1F3U7_9ASCO